MLRLYHQHYHILQMLLDIYSLVYRGCIFNSFINLFQEIGHFVIPLGFLPIPGNIYLKFKLGFSAEVKVSH